MSQSDGVSTFDADGNSLSRIIYLDLDEIVIKSDAELLSDHRSGKLQFLQHLCPLCFKISVQYMYNPSQVPFGMPRTRDGAAAFLHYFIGIPEV
jgi:hypothetical protein